MNPLTLNEVQIDEIRKLAADERRFLGFVGETPVANDIFSILERLGIMLLEYPIEPECDRPAFSAAIMYSEEGNSKLTFIGLNTADYYDKQDHPSALLVQLFDRPAESQASLIPACQ